MTQIQRQPDQPITQEIVLSTLGLKPNDANTITALALCQRYDLDPVLKHILIVKGNVYVTRDGLLYTAHKSGKLDGMEVLEMGETETHYTARVAVYRKDMSRPFVYPGRYPKDGANKVFGAEMAVKVSEVMGLRRAFSIAASVLEERWDLDPESKTGKASDVSTLEVVQVPTPLEQVNSILKDLEQGEHLERKEMRPFMAFIIGDDALNARGANPTDAQCAMFLESGLIVDGSLDTAAINQAIAEFRKVQS